MLFLSFAKNIVELGCLPCLNIGTTIKLRRSFNLVTHKHSSRYVWAITLIIFIHKLYCNFFNFKIFKIRSWIIIIRLAITRLFFFYILLSIINLFLSNILIILIINITILYLRVFINKIYAFARRRFCCRTSLTSKRWTTSRILRSIWLIVLRPIWRTIWSRSKTILRSIWVSIITCSSSCCRLTYLPWRV